MLGDTGEGGAAQHSLRDQYLFLGERPDVKFLVISSDVIYPDGAMPDYEPNFYLPFKGFTKPIYAIPGNHDWYDALEAFAANFLEADAARACMHARMETDGRLTTTTPRPDRGEDPGSRPPAPGIRREHRLAAGPLLRGANGALRPDRRRYRRPSPWLGDFLERIAALLERQDLRREVTDHPLLVETPLGRVLGRGSPELLGHSLCGFECVVHAPAPCEREFSGEGRCVHPVVGAAPKSVALASNIFVPEPITNRRVLCPLLTVVEPRPQKVSYFVKKVIRLCLGWRNDACGADGPASNGGHIFERPLDNSEVDAAGFEVALTGRQMRIAGWGLVRTNAADAAFVLPSPVPRRPLGAPLLASAVAPDGRGTARRVASRSRRIGGGADAIR